MIQYVLSFPDTVVVLANMYFQIHSGITSQQRQIANLGQFQALHTQYPLIFCHLSKWHVAMVKTWHEVLFVIEKLGVLLPAQEGAFSLQSLNDFIRSEFAVLYYWRSISSEKYLVSICNEWLIHEICYNRIWNTYWWWICTWLQAHHQCCSWNDFHDRYWKKSALTLKLKHSNHVTFLTMSRFATLSQREKADTVHTEKIQAFSIISRSKNLSIFKHFTEHFQVKT